ncbi:hypothetical protein [Hyalangium versicolor]|uniref:hypothetical protein n=1 Tax=Hyalangium versicolor TaxID=2861190 RepID=UPI00281533D5|nr:hypothetical protein [Hyalangium versicolor]
MGERHILDEPTSALDAESEALVQEARSRLMKGRTTFAMAHQRSTVVEADHILDLKGGASAWQRETTHASWRWPAAMPRGCEGR